MNVSIYALLLCLQLSVSAWHGSDWCPLGNDEISLVQIKKTLELASERSAKPRIVEGTAVEDEALRSQSTAAAGATAATSSDAVVDGTKSATDAAVNRIISAVNEDQKNITFEDQTNFTVNGPQTVNPWVVQQVLDAYIKKYAAPEVLSKKNLDAQLDNQFHSAVVSVELARQTEQWEQYTLQKYVEAVKAAKDAESLAGASKVDSVALEREQSLNWVAAHTPAVAVTTFAPVAAPIPYGTPLAETPVTDEAEAAVAAIQGGAAVGALQAQQTAQAANTVSQSATAASQAYIAASLAAADPSDPNAAKAAIAAAMDIMTILTTTAPDNMAPAPPPPPGVFYVR